jgi:hypothetical protein
MTDMRYFFTDGRKATNNKQLTLQCIMAYGIADVVDDYVYSRTICTFMGGEN